MSRLKTVFTDNDTIAHMWAHKAQNEARNPSGNFYFTGDTIYSYGSHFPIAKIVTVSKGKHKGQEAVLYTTGSYSVTTTRHISDVHDAIYRYDRNVNGGQWMEADRPVFRVDPKGTDQLAEWDSRIKAAQTALAEAPKGTRMNTKVNLFDKWVHTVTEANRYAEFFGERKRWVVPTDATSAMAALAESRRKTIAIQAKQEAKRKRERDAIYKAIRATVVPEWVGGGSGTYNDGTRILSITVLPEAYLRIWPNGHNAGGVPEVQTSHGVIFPLEHAKRTLPLVKAIIEAGKTYKRNGHTIHLGHYTLNEIQADGTVIAGCHVVYAPEVKRFAAMLESMERPANGAI